MAAWETLVSFLYDILVAMTNDISQFIVNLTRRCYSSNMPAVKNQLQRLLENCQPWMRKSFTQTRIENLKFNEDIHLFHLENIARRSLVEAGLLHLL